MNPDPSRVEEIFKAALELDTAEARTALLDRECAGDAALRVEVESLLGAMEDAGAGFLGTPALINANFATVISKRPPRPDPPSGSASRSTGAVTLPPDSYTVGDEIAHGGMGTVVEVEDRDLGRKVALKVMRLESGASEQAQARFVREATVLARLEHPNIVPIHELGRDAEGRLFYTMKLVQGRTLRDIVKGLEKREPDFLREYTLDRLLIAFRKICDALALAHSRRIIHRDLKPENIMLGEFGEVLVMDWGLAKILGDREEAPGGNAPPAVASSFTNPDASLEATLEGSVLGTPQYMSPEQALGKIDELDERSDIFSLGGILYTILTLRPPVEGKTLQEVLEKVTSASITPPTAFGTTVSGAKPGQKGEVLEARQIKPLPHIPAGRVPAALSAVAMKALRLQKEERYQDVMTFSADLEKFQSGFATSAEQAGLFTQLCLLVRRHRREFAVGFAAWLLITALAVWFVFHLRAKEQRAVAGEQKATAAEAVAVQREGETRQALGRSAISLAEAALREGNGPVMQAALKDVPENQRDSTWHYLLDQSDTSFAVIRPRGDGRQIKSVVAHPRLPGVFVVVDSLALVTVLNVRSGERLLEFTADLPVKAENHYNLAISPDGERIAVGSRGDSKSGIVIHHGRDGAKLLEWAARRTSRLEFSPDGRTLLQTENNASSKFINLWDATTGQLIWKSAGPSVVKAAKFTADGGQVLLQDSSFFTWLVGAKDGKRIRKIGEDPAVTAALRRDDRLIVTGNAFGIVRGLDAQDGHKVFEFRTDARGIDRLAFTATGDRFVSMATLTDGREAIRVWDAQNGAPVQTLLGGSGEVLDAALHPLSGELVVCGSDARAWDLGASPRWTQRRTTEAGGKRSSIAFWGNDEVVFAPATEADTTLLQLAGNTAPSTLWSPPHHGNHLARVSADGRVAAVGFAMTRQPVRLLRRDGTKVEETGSFTIPKNYQFFRLSPRGERLVLAVPSAQLVIYDTATGSEAVKLEQTGLKLISDLAWLGEERLLGLVTVKAARGSAGSEERIVVWDTATGKTLHSAVNPGTMDALAVSPDGRRFAEAGGDKKVRIRDTATLAVQQEFRGHDGAVTALAWHPARPVLATASSDLAIRLWDLATGKRIAELRGPLAAPHTLAFSPSGRRLGCASLEATTRIWEPPSLADAPASGKEVNDEQHWFAASRALHPPAPEPDAEGWANLLSPLTSEIVEKTGHGWSLKNGELFSPDTKWATLPLPGNVAASSYTVRVKLRRIAQQDVFHVVLPVADRMCGFELEGRNQGIYTGLILVNGKYGKDLPGVVEGQQVKDAEPHELEVTVRLDGASVTITATLDGRPLYEWTGPTASLSQHKGWATTEPGALALGTFAGGWAVSEVKVKRLEAGK